MLRFGFSTGALALGDFEKGLRLLEGHEASAVELSALRDTELAELMERVPQLDLTSYEYVSVHAPSRFSTVPESTCADLLTLCIERQWPVVLHPDAIQDPAVWEKFGDLLCLENMDKRKPDGRTPEEMDNWFRRYPRAGFCLDLGHARQVDPSLTLARKMVRSFADRLTQVHLSELNARSEHHSLSLGSILAFRDLGALLPPVPVILESCVSADAVAPELEAARRALDTSFAAAG